MSVSFTTRNSTGEMRNDGQNPKQVSSPSEFVSLFAERPSSLMLFYEYVVQTSRGQRVEPLVFDTLLELYLAGTPDGLDTIGALLELKKKTKAQARDNDSDPTEEESEAVGTRDQVSKPQPEKAMALLKVGQT